MFSSKKIFMAGAERDNCPRRIIPIGTCRVFDGDGNVMGFTINWRVSDDTREGKNGTYQYVWQPCAPVELGGAAPHTKSWTGSPRRTGPSSRPCRTPTDPSARPSPSARSRDRRESRSASRNFSTTRTTWNWRREAPNPDRTLKTSENVPPRKQPSTAETKMPETNRKQGFSAWMERRMGVRQLARTRLAATDSGKPDHERIYRAGWDGEGEWTCPVCGSTIGRGAGGESPFRAAKHHALKCAQQSPIEIPNRTN